MEPLSRPVLGGLTGLITAVTGVFVIPAVPFLQAIGLEKEELVQALGLSFTVSTLALAVNVGMQGGPTSPLAGTALIGSVFVAAGMAAGQAVRQHLSPAAFRGWFYAGLLMLGLYLTASYTT
jgi:uncharacterized membrane protein YfcA